LDNKNLSKTLDELVVAICRDYDRRKRIIEERSAPRRVDTELRYLNFISYAAAVSKVGEDFAELFIWEIGNRIGYAKSGVADMSEVTYKKYKQQVKEAIAHALHLTY